MYNIPNSLGGEHMKKQLENERMILSACLHSYATLEHSLMCLDPSNFYYPQHRDIFTCMSDLASRKVTITKQACLAEFRVKDDKESASTLMDFYDERLDTDYLNEKIEEMKLFSLRRDLIERCVQGQSFFSDINKTKIDFMKWTDDVSQSIMKQEGKTYRTVKDILNNFSEEDNLSFMQVVQKRQEAALKGEAIEIGYPTRYLDIDKVFDGFKPGHITIIGARPGVGKTTFALNLALKQMFDNGISVGFFSLEMPSLEITEKLILCKAGIKFDDYKCGKIDTEQFHALFDVYKQMEKKNLVIDDTGRLNLTLMESKAKYWKRVFGIKILFIDYLQLISAGGKFNNKYEEITAISQRLKIMAKELDMPIVCLAQLNRESLKSDSPQIHDLRDSGSIEQDADEIFLLHNPSGGDKAEDKYNKPGVLQVHLAKNRFGATGKFELAFMKELGKIESFSRSV